MTPDFDFHPDISLHNKSETSGTDLWIFAYGSLMWHPGFESVEISPALLHGFKRSLCIYSHVYRGTPEAPGLVLGLDSGGSCHGQAFRVAADSKEQVLAYLRQREQVTGVYIEKWLTVYLADGREVVAVVYVADPAHQQYAGELSTQAMAAIVRQASGLTGPNRDYVTSTAIYLQQMEICDEQLEAVITILNG